MKRLIALIAMSLFISCNKGPDVSKPENKFDPSKLIGKVWKWGFRERYTMAFLEFYKGDSGLYRPVNYFWPPTITYYHRPFTWRMKGADTLAMVLDGVDGWNHLITLNDSILIMNSGHDTARYSTF